MEQVAANSHGQALAGPVGIDLNNVTLRYPAPVEPDDDGDAASGALEKPAIDRLSLAIAPGSTIALVGENGSGKTTLAKVIAGLLHPTSGSITMSGADGSSGEDAVFQASTSMVFQDFTKFELTVRTFIDPAGERADEALRDGLQRAHAWEYIALLPGGLDAKLGPQWEGAGLSGGQWQRLALARTFLSAAPVWILDEPTAAVDAVAEAEIYRDVLRERPAGTTLIIISHRPQTLQTVDTIVVLDDGQIAECGHYDELLNAGGPFARLARA